MEYFAHKKSDTEKQTILAHLQGTKQLASRFALEEWAALADFIAGGHDVGKYAPAFQEKLLREKKNGYPHAAAGAIEVMELANSPHQKMLACMVAYCIAGHHAGLPDGGVPDDTPDNPTLYGTLARKQNYTGAWDYSAYHNEVKLSLPDPAPLMTLMQPIKEKTWEENKRIFLEKYAFLTRYLFSCLTDADFLDTERYCSPEIDRSTHADFESAENAVSAMLSDLCQNNNDTALQKARAMIQAQAFSAAGKYSGICTLNMPTGSGKTLCSLQIAMQKIKASNGRLKRIIYVIPYTSIIEQTAKLFEDIIGKHVTILQHHSNYSYDPKNSRNDIPDADTAEKLKRAAENWDAPVVITTSVQFFESLYHYKGSKLRKLHNLADAVIVLDEIHMLPVRQLQPCLAALSHINQILHSEILLLSATMPDYKKQFRRIAPDCPVYDLITDTSEFRHFEKCTYHDLGKTSYETIAMKAAGYQSSLIVVNSRAAAREVYSLLAGNKYHLSTWMTPQHRSEVIGEIRKKLGKEPVTVVSTSLIEAGVDLDFETVFRELAGLDNILQAAGRCNREGIRSHGDVFIFRAEHKPQRDLAIRADITESVMKKYKSPTAPECIREYYDQLFDFRETEIKRNTIAEGSNISKTGFVTVPFCEYAQAFAMIDTDTVSVVIPDTEEAKKLLEELRFGKRSVLRELQKYSVSLHIHGEMDKAYPNIVAEYENTGVLVLKDENAYNRETGLDIENSLDFIFG